MHSRPVLLTRPEAESLHLAADLRAMGADRVEISPLMRVEIAGPLPRVAGGVLLTSGNAVRAFVALGGAPGHVAWVVGPRTAGLARDAGFDVRGVAADVDALVELVPPDPPPLVHLRGEVTRGDLAARLDRRGIAVAEAVVYRQIAQDLTAAALALISEGPVIVPLYSPRSAVLLARACPPGRMGHLRLLALSDAVARDCPVSPLGISETPDGKGMLALIGRHLSAIGG